MTRLPTESNIADLPSRGELNALLSEEVPHHHIDLETMWSQLLSLATGGGEDQQLEPHVGKVVCGARASARNLRKQSEGM